MAGMVELDVINHALGRLGLPSYTSIDDLGGDLLSLKNDLDFSRRVLLSSDTYPFTKKSLILQSDGVEPVVPSTENSANFRGVDNTDYQFRFVIPDNFLRIINVISNSRVRDNNFFLPILQSDIVDSYIRYATNGSYLYSDVNAIRVDYIDNITEPHLMPPDFVDCWSKFLAYRNCKLITGDSQREQTLYAEFNEAKARSLFIRAYENRADQKYTTSSSILNRRFVSQPLL